MFALARRWLDRRDAIFAAALYTVNPYYIVIIYWRSAYAELLAGALIPLLLLYALRLEEEKWRAAIVVGMPTHLDGTPSPQTSRVASFIDRLKTRTALTIATEGERLSSREAESRLAIRERDWRKRKKQLDAAAAAIILQDYLDREPRT